VSTQIVRRLSVLSVAGVAVITLAACGNKPTEGSASGPTLPSAQEEASPSASAAESSGPRTNARGNIVKAIGEEGGITNPAGDQLLTFAVDSITVDPACTADWQEYGIEPEPGHHLVAVKLRASTSAAVTDSDYLTLSGYDFKYIGRDGITVGSLDGMATSGCLDDSQSFTGDALGPAQMYAGSIVLEVPGTSGTLVMAPSWGQVSGGWEYAF
jgi:hypothetical protein